MFENGASLTVINSRKIWTFPLLNSWMISKPTLLDCCSSQIQILSLWTVTKWTSNKLLVSWDLELGLETQSCTQLHSDTERECTGWGLKVVTLTFLTLTMKLWSMWNFSKKTSTSLTSVTSVWRDLSVGLPFQWCTDFSNKNSPKKKSLTKKWWNLQLHPRKS